MSKNEYQTKCDETTTSCVDVLEEGKLPPSGIFPSTSEHEYMSFLENDPCHVKVTATSDAIEIEAMPMVESNSVEDLEKTLHQLLELKQLPGKWSLDLAAIKTFNLRFMDLLLTIGRHLHLRGGALTITGFRVPAALAMFSEPFKKRCQDHHITWITCNENSPN